MTTFADSAHSFLRARPDESERQRAWAGFEARGLPTTVDEVWRYAPLGGLDLDRYVVPNEPGDAADSAADNLSASAARVVSVVDGYCVDAGSDSPELTVQRLSPASGEDDPDAFSLLGGALSPETTLVRVAPGATLVSPVVILQRVASSAAFPTTRIELGAGAQAVVVECLVGGADALVVPSLEVDLADGASLRLLTYQRLASSAWHVGRSLARLGRDARLHQAVVGIGGHYDRSRNDAVLVGASSQNELRTTFLGSGDQVHDFRTHQLHLGARSRSTLLSKGAVADSSRSIYTGLIEIEKGARRTDARQTNHNLLLSRHAHADSVPNLDIRENDVLCAHASTVGPLDELQLWYLASRGVERADARRLLLVGFFNEMLAEMPVEVARLVEGDVTSVLSRVEMAW
ncbi:MAG: SufB/SufD family protein [Acidimicrobiales bacterium]